MDVKRATGRRVSKYFVIGITFLLVSGIASFFTPSKSLHVYSIVLIVTVVANVCVSGYCSYQLVRHGYKFQPLLLILAILLVNAALLTWLLLINVLSEAGNSIIQNLPANAFDL